MTIREVDDFVNWFKTNVLDIPQSGNDSDGRGPESPTNRSYGHSRGHIHLDRTETEADTRTEYDFPLSLWEHILGLDRL